jgi:hypothetical protein
MIYYDETGVVFLHIPKTAGTSIVTLLNRYYIHEQLHHRHSTLAQNVEKYGKKYFEDLKIVTAIRNPFDRAVSMYFWYQQSGDKHKYPFKRLADNHSFSNWIDIWYITEELSFEDYMLVDGNLWDNFEIIRFENLKADIDYIFTDKLGLSINCSKLPHIWPTKRKNYEVYYTPELYDKIYQKDSWLIHNFYTELLEGR